MGFKSPENRGNAPKSLAKGEGEQRSPLGKGVQGNERSGVPRNNKTVTQRKTSNDSCEVFPCCHSKVPRLNREPAEPENG